MNVRLNLEENSDSSDENSSDSDDERYARQLAEGARMVSIGVGGG